MVSTATRSPTSTPQRWAAPVADAVYPTQGFVARNDGHGRFEHAFKLFVIAAADATGLDTKQGIVMTNLGNR